MFDNAADLRCPFVRRQIVHAVVMTRVKIPIAILIGDKDEYFRLFAVRKTQTALAKAGHPVNLTVIPGHRHAYADVALEVNRNAWQFMKANRL
jgi:dienelactone hydrolase